MLISTKGTYAIRVLCYMANNYEINEAVSSFDLSNNLGISKKYLESIMTLLSKNKIVDVTRGKSGGYSLNKRAEEYSLLEILRVTEKNLAPVACLQDKGEKCEHCDKCPGYKTFEELDNIIVEYLKNKSLADLRNNG